MASRSVSLLKFVGTVSLGLLTGLSYSLSTLTAPTLLTLPSANTAAQAFKSLTSTARTQLRALASVSGTAFALAFLLSPRPYRHPYLLYASLLGFGSSLVTLDAVAPYLYLRPRGPVRSGLTGSSANTQKKEKARAPMEASYEVLGSASDAHSEGTSGEEVEGDEESGAQFNGEEVRGEVEAFLKKQWFQTSVAGLGFMMAVIGIWGDGAVEVFQSETFVIEV